MVWQHIPTYLYYSSLSLYLSYSQVPSLLLVYGKTFLIYPEWCQKKPEKWWMNGKLVFYNEATQTLLGLLCMTLSLIRKKNTHRVSSKSPLLLDNEVKVRPITRSSPQWMFEKLNGHYSGIFYQQSAKIPIKFSTSKQRFRKKMV